MNNKRFDWFRVLNNNKLDALTNKPFNTFSERTPKAHDFKLGLKSCYGLPFGI
jgi:hypothetical protein